MVKCIWAEAGAEGVIKKVLAAIKPTAAKTNNQKNTIKYIRTVPVVSRAGNSFKNVSGGERFSLLFLVRR